MIGAYAPRIWYGPSEWSQVGMGSQFTTEFTFTRMKEQLQAIVTVLSLVNPVLCGAMFARIEAQRSAAERRSDAMKVALVIVAILAVAALIGTQLLRLFGVSLDAFMVAGGAVLVF
jgi:multiple antibiotic resistance protein